MLPKITLLFSVPGYSRRCKSGVCSLPTQSDADYLKDGRIQEIHNRHLHKTSYCKGRSAIQLQSRQRRCWTEEAFNHEMCSRVLGSIIWHRPNNEPLLVGRKFRARKCSMIIYGLHIIVLFAYHNSHHSYSKTLFSSLLLLFSAFTSTFE